MGLGIMVALLLGLLLGAKPAHADTTFTVNSTGNRIRRNSIFSNDGLGIDLIGGNENAAGATANDVDDPDAGPNNLQNKPVIDSAITAGGSTIIEVRLNSTPNRTFTIEFFSNPAGNEGKTFLRQRSVTTNSNGNTGTVAVTVEDPSP